MHKKIFCSFCSRVVLLLVNSLIILPGGSINYTYMYQDFHKAWF